MTITIATHWPIMHDGDHLGCNLTCDMLKRHSPFVSLFLLQNHVIRYELYL